MSEEEFKIAPAVRRNPRLLISVIGQSGDGKTKSALLLARGIVGPKGRIVGVDTEDERMSDYAGRYPGDPECEIPGGFSVVNLRPPFSPDRCKNALLAAAAKADIVVYDSGSHEWNGEGGCLQMVEKFIDEKAGNEHWKRDSYKMMAWASVGQEHAYYFNAIARFGVPLIICFRAKDKIKIGKEERTDARGNTKEKTVISKLENEPISRGDIVYEMKLSFLVEQRGDGGGYWSFKKRGPETLARTIEACKQDRLGVVHGQAIAEWASGGTTKPEVTPNPTNVPKVATEATRQWFLGQIPEDKKQRLHAYAIDESIIEPNDPLEKWPLESVPTTRKALTDLLTKVDQHP